MLPAAQRQDGARWARLNRWAQVFGLTTGRGCDRLRWLAGKARGLRAEVEVLDPGQCRLGPRRGARQEPANASVQARELARQQLAGYGLVLDEGSCVTLDSRIGQGRYPYQWCRVGLAR
jgi:hypothetical protein